MKKILMFIFSMFLVINFSVFSNVNAINSLDIELMDIYAEATKKAYISGYTDTASKYFKVEVTFRYRYNDANGNLVGVISTNAKIIQGPNDLFVHSVKGCKLDNKTANITLTLQRIISGDGWHGSKNIKV